MEQQPSEHSFVPSTNEDVGETSFGSGNSSALLNADGIPAGLPSLASSDPDVHVSLPEIKVNGENVEQMLSEILLEDSPPPNGDNVSLVSSANEVYKDKLQRAMSSFNCILARHTRKYLIFTSSGKPVFSNVADESLEPSTVAALQAIISSFEVIKEDLIYFETRSTIIVAHSASPLNLVCISPLTTLSPEFMKNELKLLYHQILSIITNKSISSILDSRPNYDLRRLIGSSEQFLRVLSSDLERYEPFSFLNAISPIPLRVSFRDQLSQLLLKEKPKSLIFALLAVRGRLVCAIKARKLMLHASDLYLIFLSVFNTQAFNDSMEHWVPICLPNLNPNAYLYIYSHFVHQDIALILASNENSSFFDMQEMRNTVSLRLKERFWLQKILHAAELDQTSFRNPGFPCILHYLFYSKKYSQFYAPGYTFNAKNDPKTLYAIYAGLHDQVFHRKRSLSIDVEIHGSLMLFTWSTSSFNFYCVANANANLQIPIANINKILRWIRREETRLFICTNISF
ncbi:autophagy associated protein Aut12 [Schizosaccharomyces cryophilus OY26]|uniref:Vacuolar fusion protein MON1 n=1 Tax=Schizosaccharomyces cryophilus (strain OY26 / ATCC MYA-4695 / CBS 11777 / NBRC 106824 / NRRL Y48691) TaxID=653667 RepID=S9W2C5_SCHCR|nr:autophagy associated protein Aut12 [Schizosaccharomyces cryophilus OY26]EPY54188.1 autophagy associated protein Aut12 [Schizosaccharomyces cryophilus OY26]